MGRRTRQPASATKSPSTAGSLIIKLGLVIALVAVAGVVSFGFSARTVARRLDIEYLVSLSNDELAKYGISELNLACASGLPGGDGINTERMSKKLETWAVRVRSETDRHLYQFRQNPEEFEHSEAYFRMLLLITVVMQDFGVHFNKARIRDVDFTNSEDLFIHGILLGKGGTCVSLPVVYTAVGRRLGYPLKLVATKGHVFLRWDDPRTGEKLNIEGTSQHGMNTNSDEYYTTWPHPLTEREIKGRYYLNSQTPKQELAGFLASRGRCLEDNGRLEEAVQAYDWAAKLSPENPVLTMFMKNAQAMLAAGVTSKHGPQASPFGRGGD